MPKKIEPVLTPAPENVNLYYKDDHSDKVYQAQLEQKDAGWVVNFQYGPRSGSFQTGTKTSTPVEFAAAKKAYNKLVAEKTGKGYTPDSTGKLYQALPSDKEHSGIFVQLLNPVREEDSAVYFNDSAWMMQEKFFGERRPIKLVDGQVKPTNRKGIYVAFSKVIEEAILKLPCKSAVFDSEDMGDFCVLFDILELDGKDLKNLGAEQRLSILYKLVGRTEGAMPGGGLRIVKTVFSKEDKLTLHKEIKDNSREGDVFKKRDAPYEPGRPSSGGNQIKLKNLEHATCLVTSHHSSKSSIGFSLLDDKGAWVEAGNAKITGKKPNIGGLVEIEYLFANKSHCLQEPVFMFERNDVGIEACTTAQLKYKNLATLEEEIELEVRP